MADYSSKVIDGTIQSNMTKSETDGRGWAGQPYERGPLKPAEVVLPDIKNNKSIYNNSNYKQNLSLTVGYINGLVDNPKRIPLTFFKTLDGAKTDKNNAINSMQSTTALSKDQLRALGEEYKAVTGELTGTYLPHPYKNLGEALIRLADAMDKLSKKGN